MWLLQIRTGDMKGAWRWNSIDLDPWEQPESTFYGASVAALAVGSAPSDYQQRSNIRPNVEALRAYLKRSQRAQPLHNGLIQLWASSRLNGVLSEIDRQAICNDVLRRQASDGGWTLSSLGPWRDHPNARVIDGSNAYATALVAFILQRSDVSREHPRLKLALAWLQAHQDRTGGFWDAHSMNKHYPPDSVPVNFMRDAATAFAVLALLEGN
jgi:squalene-hopene/tetraprenyl-beta-curcumene cyclase